MMSETIVGVVTENVQINLEVLSGHIMQFLFLGLKLQCSGCGIRWCGRSDFGCFCFGAESLRPADI
jgi:hypothetical protein